MEESFAQSLHSGYFNPRFQLYHDDCLAVLKSLEDSIADSLVTDPPAGIAFMGKEWDRDKGGRDEWVKWMTDVMRECLRVLKPGAHGLVWALPRTAHWTATALEDAGFEVRDCVTHLFGTGFPKSLDVSKAIDRAAGAERAVIGQRKADDIRGGNLNHRVCDGDTKTHVIDITAPATDAAKQWQGWGTALKPACEFWWLVRKPISEKTVAANVLKWGTGAINVDGCRIGVATDEPNKRRATGGYASKSSEATVPNAPYNSTRGATLTTGRFPANLVLDEEAARALDEQSGERGGGFGVRGKGGQTYAQGNGFANTLAETGQTVGYGDSGGASRFFYTAKASKADRGAKRGVDNKHPTVKPTSLMRYLIELVTPPKGIVLDAFMGSGTTGEVALERGFSFIGVEQDKVSFDTAKARLRKAPQKI